MDFKLKVIENPDFISLFDLEMFKAGQDGQFKMVRKKDEIYFKRQKRNKTNILKMPRAEKIIRYKKGDIILRYSRPRSVYVKVYKVFKSERAAFNHIYSLLPS